MLSDPLSNFFATIARKPLARSILALIYGYDRELILTLEPVTFNMDIVPVLEAKSFGVPGSLILW